MARVSWTNLFTGCCVSGNTTGEASVKLVPKQSSLLSTSSSSTISDPLVSILLESLSFSLAESNLYVFTLAELHLATKGFSSSNFLGEGGFGPVYKGFLDERVRQGMVAQAVAVKLLDPDGVQGHQEWLAEVILLGKLRHPNLVRLIGYCYEDERRLLVYEYMAKGNLENHLFKRFYTSLPWATRLKIAVGAAKGLAFLHETEKPVIYRDFKASNILLDSDYTAKLSDFGLATEGPEGDNTHISTRIMGTEGYTAPEYIMTGHLTTKSDVYSFGVVLLELLTGRRSVDVKRPARERNLVEWARPCLKDDGKLLRIMDPDLNGVYSTKAAQKAAATAYQCLSQKPKLRPKMSAVVEVLEPLLELKDAIMGTFVFTVPGNGGDDEKKMSNSVGGKNRNTGQRHKVQFNQFQGRHDLSLYRNMQYK